jgi:hypothetical protein
MKRFGMQINESMHPTIRDAGKAVVDKNGYSVEQQQPVYHDRSRDLKVRMP